MGLNDLAASERTHIGFFGKRNAGKSSVVNAVTNQSIAIVSDKLGTTTDPVVKTMEILPLGPVVIIDTPGFDDEGELGKLRVSKARQILNKTDVAVLVVDITAGMKECDEELVRLFEAKKLPYIIAFNKSDLTKSAEPGKAHSNYPDNSIIVSAVLNLGINELREKIAALDKAGKVPKYIIRDLIKKGDTVVLVIPIDESAPKGRIILPQQNVLREVLDCHAAAVVVQDSEYAGIYDKLRKNPDLVITDSQAFDSVAANTPDEVGLTSFSILLSRYKGYLKSALKGVDAIKKLKDEAVVLIAEGCTHHRQCNDIGTVKLPGLLKKHTGKEIKIRTCSGTEFPEDLSDIDLIIHCGGCMINEREMRYRVKCAEDQNVPILNYGIAFAYFGGILERSIKVFKEL